MNRTRRRSLRWFVIPVVASLFGCSGATEDDAPPGDPPIEAPAIEGGVWSVWGSESNDVWAVGASGLILHYDGTRWSEIESPTDRDLLAVHGSGASDVWAVGDDVILRWDGGAWHEELVDFYELLVAVWASSPDDVWMVGLATDVSRALLRHWDGEQWAWATTGASSMLWAVWASAPNDVWTAGSTVEGGGFLAHGDGMVFDPVEYEGGPARGLWGSGADDVWVTSYDGPLQHWNGTEWSRVAGEAAEGALAVAGTGAGDVWAVGSDGGTWHWDEHEWTAVDSGVTQTLRAVWAASVDDAWAVGGDGTIVHWDGAKWTRVRTVEPKH